MDGERKKIMEKRSSLRSWRERGGKLPRRDMYTIIAGVFIVLLALIFYSFLSNNASNSSSLSEQQNKTPSLPENISKSTPKAAKVQAPSIKLNSPKNVIYNTSTPPLDLVVSGNNLSVVLFSVDGGGNITIPHDGKTAITKTPLLIQVFHDEFSNENKWTNVGGKWNVKNGRYAAEPSGNFSIALADMNITANKFAIECTINNKGPNASEGLIFSYKNSSDFYYAIALEDTRQWAIGKYDGKFNHKTVVNDSKLQVKKDYRIKLLIIDGEVTLYTDGIEKAKYNFGTLQERSHGLLAINSSTEFDDFSVFLPLSDGGHKLDIFAKDTAGNISSQTVNFNVSLDVVGKLGMPIAKKGIEITLQSVTPSILYTRVGVSARNMEATEKLFKLTPSPILIGNMGNQYENIKVARSGEISQTNLYGMAKRDGAVYFERLKEGDRPKKIVLYVNGDKLEFMLN
jgi:hypothetical protein